MAIFANYTNNPAPKEYLGLSKEPDRIQPNAVAATAIKGAAQLGELGIKALDTYNEETIKKEVEATVNSGRQANTQLGLDILNNVVTPQSGITVPATSASATGGTPGLTLNDPNVPTTNMGQPATNLPPEVQSGLSVANKMAQAQKMGKFDDVNYYGNMQAKAQELSSKYPGYSDYIRQQFTTILGVNPANAERKAVQDTLTQLYAKTNSAQAAWTKEVMDMAPIIGKEQTELALSGAVTGDPVRQNQMRVYFAGLKSEEHKKDQAKKDVDLAKAQGTLNTETAERGFATIADTEFNKLMSAKTMALSNGTHKYGDILKSANQFMSEGKPDPQKQQAYAMALSKIKLDLEQSLRMQSMDPRFKDSNGNTYLTPDAIKRIIEQKTAVFDTSIKFLGEGYASLATAPAAFMKASQENDALKLLADQGMRTLAAISTTNIGGQGLGAVVSSMWATKPDMLGTTASFLTNTRTLDVITKGNGSLMDSIDRWKDAHPTSDPAAPNAKASAIPAQYLKAEIDAPKQVLNHKDAPQDAKVNAARVLANEGTLKFTQQFQGNEQINVWARINTPDVVAGIKQLEQTGADPDIWQKYKTLQQQGLVRFGNTYAAQVQQGFKDSLGTNIKFENGQFTYIDVQKMTPLQRANPGAAQGVLSISNQTKDSIDKLNALIRTYAPVAKAEGETIDEAWLKKNFDIELKYEKPKFKTPGVIQPEVEIFQKRSDLDPIRKLLGTAEARGNYNALFGNVDSKLDLSQLSIDQVQALQKDMVRKGSPSSAAGLYQFLGKTLGGLKKELALTGEEKFTPELQDKLAEQLMKRRGLDKYLAGEISKDQFADNLAKEWASLPLASGQSYYASDGLNKAQTTRDKVLAAIDAYKGRQGT